jgi:hypothetical protein
VAVVVVVAADVEEATSKAVDVVVTTVAEAVVAFLPTTDTILQMAMAPIPKHPHNINNNNNNNNNNKAHNLCSCRKLLFHNRHLLLLLLLQTNTTSCMHKHAPTMSNITLTALLPLTAVKAATEALHIHGHGTGGTHKQDHDVDRMLTCFTLMLMCCLIRSLLLLMLNLLLMNTCLLLPMVPSRWSRLLL